MLRNGRFRCVRILKKSLGVFAVSWAIGSWAAFSGWGAVDGGYSVTLEAPIVTDILDGNGQVAPATDTVAPGASDGLSLPAADAPASVVSDGQDADGADITVVASNGQSPTQAIGTASPDGQPEGPAGSAGVSVTQTPFGPGMTYLDGQKITMLAGQGDGQMMSFVIETAGGRLIVVDGGRVPDAQRLTSFLMERGGHVSAWLLTHAHDDHVGALYTILNDPDSPLTIDGVYYSMFDAATYTAFAPEDNEWALRMLDTFSKTSPWILHPDVRAGYELYVDEVHIMALNSAYLCESDVLNNSSVVWRMEMGSRNVLFLGDLAEEGGWKLRSDIDSALLRADVVQMAHHGQNGVDRSFYEAVFPQVCLWTTPQWLWDNDAGGGPGTGPWRTLETRAWMAELGVALNLSVKDGDKTLK
jgi:hypothetical protein